MSYRRPATTPCIRFGIHVYLPPADDPDDDRFGVGFVTSTGRCLRVRLPGDQLEALGELLLGLVRERRLHGDV
jgi:hypothetical protein